MSFLGFFFLQLHKRSTGLTRKAAASCVSGRCTHCQRATRTTECHHKAANKQGQEVKLQVKCVKRANSTSVRLQCWSSFPLLRVSCYVGWPSNFKQVKQSSFDVKAPNLNDPPYGRQSRSYPLRPGGLWSDTRRLPGGRRWWHVISCRVATRDLSAAAILPVKMLTKWRL